jgi:hypothetical protein
MIGPSAFLLVHAMTEKDKGGEPYTMVRYPFITQLYEISPPPKDFKMPKLKTVMGLACGHVGGLARIKFPEEEDDATQDKSE